MKTLQKLRGCFLLIFFITCVTYSFRPPEVVRSQGVPDGPEDLPRPQQVIATHHSGLEKIAPDLRSILDTTVEAAPGLAGPAQEEPVMVTVMTEPGVDVSDYFLRSTRSREFSGYQWTVGEIFPDHLLQLAGETGVTAVFSPDTYHTQEAPGLEDLRAHYPALDAQEIREILVEKGPEGLRSHFDREIIQNSGRISGAPGRVMEIQPGGENLGLLDVHDVRRVWSSGYQGDDVVVALVDTGVDFSHPDLQGTQAVISGGPYAGWPFAYDTLSGVRYALDPQYLTDPENVWSTLGDTQYVGTLPVEGDSCTATTCTASLEIGDAETTGILVSVSWPNTSQSGAYRYTVHPDIRLLNAAYYLGLNYPEGWSPPLIIVSDTTAAGVYDTVYVDINYNKRLGDPGEKLTKEQPLGGLDLSLDDTWDLSAGMLSWISDGVHHPPGVADLYPGVLETLPPAPGVLLSFINDQNGHGTNCASLIAGQGIISDPRGLGPTNPLYAGAASIGGVGGPVIQGMAPGAKIAAFQNGFDYPLDAWTLAVMGMDDDGDPADGAQIVSNSWGASDIIEDGWDEVSRYAQHLSYEVAPAITFLVATGNGGHGYGTVTSPDGGPIIDVGASTAYGAVKGFEMVTPEQYLSGEVQPWSNRGPGTLGETAPDIVAVGAWGTGAQPLNYYFGDGQSAYDVFGGTSMSTPVVAGSLALIYQAYYARYHAWPGWEEARAILLNGAQDLGYDVFTQGAGNLQAGRSIDIINQLAPTVEPQEWRAGTYRGERYAAFPAMLHPGEADMQVFTLRNPTSEEATFELAQGYFRMAHEVTFTLSFSPPAPTSKYNLPVFLEDITGLVDQYHPALVRAQVTIPYASFDTNDDGHADNWWAVSFYDWEDLNQDQNLWVDANRDGMVDEGEIDVDAVTGVYEFNRFTYGYPQSTVIEASLGSQAAAQRHDGIFLGLGCYYCGESLTLQVRLTFYEKTDWDWLTLSAPSLSVPAGGQATFSATLTPVGAEPGIYESAIEIRSPAGSMIVPVVAVIAANSPTFNFGGPDDAVVPYENGRIFGGFNWNWRYEAGDWRFFYYDLADGSQAPGKSLLVETRWDVPRTDIDTWVMGRPKEANPSLSPGIYGPQELVVLGGSADTYSPIGSFLWNTNTGTSRELVGIPLQDGLGLVALHNVLSGGGQPVEGFSGSVFEFSSQPGLAEIDLLPESAQAPYLTGTQAFTFTSTGDIPDGIQLRAYGFNPPVNLSGQVIRQNTSYNICSASWVYQAKSGGLKISHGGLLEITTHSAAPDLNLNLYLFRDNGDGMWGCSRDALVDYSLSTGSDEQMKIYFPEDGTYWVVVHGARVPEGQGTFDIKIRAVQGTGISLRNLPSGPIKAGQPVTVETSFHSQYNSADPTYLEGLLLVGPPAIPSLVEVPIRLRPTILLSPQPELTTPWYWLQQTPHPFYVTFQNQGTEAEQVEVQVTLPDEMAYDLGFAPGSEVCPVYNFSGQTLTWMCEVDSEEQVALEFRAAALPGVPMEQAPVQARLEGLNSGQVWEFSTSVWLNSYGIALPFIRK